MASKLTVYKNVFTGYSSENRFWMCIFFFLKLLSYSRRFQNTALSDCFTTPPPRDEKAIYVVWELTYCWFLPLTSVF